MSGRAVKNLVAAVAVVAVVLVAVACSASTPPTAPPTAATNSPAPTPTRALATPTPLRTETASATPSPQAEPDSLDFPSVACCVGTSIETGTYALPGWLAMPLVIDIPDGWRVLNEARAGLFLLGRGENVQGNPSQMALFLNATGEGTTESIVGGILGVPQFEPGSEPSPVTLAGFSGHQGRATALPNPDYEGDPTADIPPGVQPLPAIARYFAEGFAWTTSTPEAELFLTAVEVGDQTLLVYLEAPPGELDALAADAIPMLESLTSQGQ